MLASFLVGLLLAAAAAPQDPQAVAPRAYRREFENERVRVTRVHYEPRERVPRHDHPDSATVYVYLRDSGPVRFVHTGEEAFTLVRPAVRAGGFRLGRGAKETHAVESLTDLPTDFLRIELKGLSDAERRSFRGRFPPGPRGRGLAARRARAGAPEVRGRRDGGHAGARRDVVGRGRRRARLRERLARRRRVSQDRPEERPGPLAAGGAGGCVRMCA